MPPGATPRTFSSDRHSCLSIGREAKETPRWCTARQAGMPVATIEKAFLARRVI